MKKLRKAVPDGISIRSDGSLMEEGQTVDNLFSLNQPMRLVEEKGDDGVMRVEGVALVDEALSSNRRYYSRLFNDRCMEETNRAMADGTKPLIVTMYARHGKALGPPGGMPTALPVGRVVDPFWREGNKIMYRAIIAPTTEGRDVQTLIRTEVMLPTSIRAANYKATTRKMGGMVVEEMQEAIIIGIDFADDPGISGAGIKRVLEEAPEWDKEQEDREVEDMEWDKLTLEELTEHRKDLLDQHTASVVEALQAQVLATASPELAAAQEKLAEAEVVQAKLVEEKLALEKSIADDILKDKIATAARFGTMSQIVYEELCKAVKTEEDIAKLLPSIRDKAMSVVLSGAQPQNARPISGSAKPPVVEEADPGQEVEEEVEMTEEARKILRLSR
jgi:hypothetical protein